MSQEPPANSPRGSRAEITLRIGSADIRLRADPLETILRSAELDAVVSSDDSVLSMSGGVSAVIAKLAGTAIREEVASELPLPVGAVAITSAGKLPVRYIIHAVTVDWKNDVLPTPRTIRQLVREILSRCEALRIKRIAMPALATGAAGLSPMVSAKIIAEALHEHVLNPTVLQSVILPIPEPLIHEAFARELAMPFLEEITAVSLRAERRKIRAPRVHIEYDVDRTVPGSSADEVDTIGGAPHDVTIEPDVGNGDDEAGQLSDDLSDSGPAHGAVRRRAESVTARDRWLGSRLLWWFRTRRKSERSTSTTETQTISAPTPVLSHRAHRDEMSLLGGAASRPLLNSRYVLLEELGRGGMAIVYLSWDLVLQRIVAIKVLRPDSADPQSLRREAAAALELTHEGVVRLYHFEPGGIEKQPFLVMEYLPWPSGEKWIADAGASGLPVHSVIDVGLHVCNALAHAHSRNILHLDIKPSNIFVDPGGENAKLGDFGLARVSSPGGTVLQLTPAGTPSYMAPEQTTRGARVSPGTDVYQLAATLWDFMTGKPPRPGRLNVEGSEPARRRILSVLLEGLVPEPESRPSAIQLREMVA